MQLGTGKLEIVSHNPLTGRKSDNCSPAGLSLSDGIICFWWLTWFSLTEEGWNINREVHYTLGSQQNTGKPVLLAITTYLANIYEMIPTKDNHYYLFTRNYCSGVGWAGMAQWWERPPPTNVSRVQFPDPASFACWVCCWFSSLLQEVFPQVLRFYPLPKNQHFQNPILAWKVSPISAKALEDIDTKIK